MRDREIWHVQSMGSKRVGDDSVTKQQQQSHNQRGKKRGKLEGHKYEGLPCFFPLESPHFKNVPLVPRVLVSLSPVKRIQMTLFVWKLACQRCHLCQKAALQWRERWLRLVDLPFLVPSNQKSILAVLNCPSPLKIHHFLHGRAILGCSPEAYHMALTSTVTVVI